MQIVTYIIYHRAGDFARGKEKRTANHLFSHHTKCESGKPDSSICCFGGIPKTAKTTVCQRQLAAHPLFLSGRFWYFCRYKSTDKTKYCIIEVKKTSKQKNLKTPLTNQNCCSIIYLPLLESFFVMPKNTHT